VWVTLWVAVCGATCCSVIEWCEAGERVCCNVGYSVYCSMCCSVRCSVYYSVRCRALQCVSATCGAAAYWCVAVCVVVCFVVCVAVCVAVCVVVCAAMSVAMCVAVCVAVCVALRVVANGAISCSVLQCDLTWRSSNLCCAACCSELQCAVQ